MAINTSTAPLQVTVPSTLTTSQHISTSSFMPNVKLDVKQYPMFNGDGASWIKFKEGVLSLASTHGLNYVFDEHKVSPVLENPDFTTFQD